MKNFIQSGDSIAVTAPAGGVASGAGVVVGALFGVAATDTAEGAPVTLVTEGVFTLPKLLTAVLAAGGRVAWDEAHDRCDAPAGGYLPIGVATEAAGNGAATVKVRLDGTGTGTAHAAIADADASNAGIAVNTNDTTAVATAAELDAVAGKVNAMLAALRTAGIIAA